MKQRYTLILALLLTLTTTANAARPADRDPFPRLTKIIRFIKFIVQPHDAGIMPPHP